MLSGIQLYLIFLCLAKKYYKRHSPKPKKNNNPQASSIFRNLWSRRGRDRMVVGFTTTCVISAYLVLNVLHKKKPSMKYPQLSATVYGILIYHLTNSLAFTPSESS